MLTARGAMAGYWDTGSRKMERAPASITRMPMTQAKIGRSMKNRATGSLPRGGGRHGVHDRSGPDLLQPLDDDQLPGPDAVGDEPGVPDGPLGDELAALHLLLGVHDHGHWQALLVSR